MGNHNRGGKMATKEPEEIAISVRIPADDADELDAIAATEDRSRTSVVRRAIRREIEAVRAAQDQS